MRAVLDTRNELINSKLAMTTFVDCWDSTKVTNRAFRIINITRATAVVCKDRYLNFDALDLIWGMEGAKV